MTMRSYDDDDFRPWYVRDTKRYLQLSLEARGLVAELLRKWDRHGRLPLSADPVGDLAFILRTDEDATRRAFVELTEPSKAFPVPRLMWDPVTLTLSDPDFLRRDRRGKSAERMANKRARDAKQNVEQPANDSDPPSSLNPKCDVTGVTSVTSVTERHTHHKASPSSLVLSDLSPERSEEPSRSPRATPEPDKPTPWSVGGGGLAAQQQFEAAVHSATGKPFTLGRGAWHQGVLCDLLNVHAKARSKPEALEWLEQTVREWVDAEGGESAAGWEPKALLRWLNGNRKAFAASKSKAEPGGASARARVLLTPTGTGER